MKHSKEASRKLIWHGLGTFAFVMMFVLLLPACRKSPRCWGEDKNKGEIVESIPLGFCTFSENQLWDNAVIRTQAELDTALACNASMPEIDFTKHSLLIAKAEGLCVAKVIRKVTIDDDAKSCVYKIKIRSCGWCKVQTLHENAVLIPKIPEDYTVEFDVDAK